MAIKKSDLYSSLWASCDGMFVQGEKFVEENGGRIGDIAVYGQVSNSTTLRLAMMSLAIRGIEGVLGPEHADTLRRNCTKTSKPNPCWPTPPCNDSDWHRSDEDVVRENSTWQAHEHVAENLSLAV